MLYRTLDSYHKTANTEKKDLALQDLANLFFSNKIKDKAFYEDVFDGLDKYEPALDTVASLCSAVKRSTLLRELSIKSYEVAEGKEDFTKITQLLQKFNIQEEDSSEDEYITDDVEALIAKTYTTPGLRWRLSALNRMLGSLRKGNFGMVFARPETGKTTFLASEVTHMATQLKEGAGPIVWLNNEQVHEEVKLRIVQAALDISLTQLMGASAKYNQEYKETWGGKILIPANWNNTKQDTERLCKKLKPSLLIIDQIDAVKGFDADREDLLLGKVYQWFREIAKQYCPVIAVCQADGTGENVKWLTMGHVANAKTSKQAMADWILGIGKIHDTGWENIRFLHASKNKLAGDTDSDPALRHGKLEVLIQPMTARFKDIA